MVPWSIKSLALGATICSIGNAPMASAACGSVPLGIQLPSDYGLDKCVGSHVWELVGSAVGSSFQCSMFNLSDLTRSKPLTQMTTVLKKILAAPEYLPSILYEAMTTTNAGQVDAFCKDWSKLVAPCAQAFTPKLIAIIKNDLECCGQLSDALDLLNLVVPPTVSKESFLLTEIVNGVNSFVCAKRHDTQQTCGFSMFQQLTAKYSASGFRVFESILLPFASAAAGEECNAFQGLPYKSSLSPASPASTAIDYSCCVDHMRPLLTSVQNAFEYVVSNSPLEFLNGIVEFTSPDATFLDALQASSGKCNYKATCAAPSGLTNYQPRTITPGTNDPKKNALSADTICTKTTKCDAEGNTCSEVCARGTVALPPWVTQSLAYQRKLAYSGPLCFAQLPATHNSAITLADGFGNRDQLMNLNLNANKPYSFMKTNNHVLSVTDQLRMGVRWLEVDVHYFLNDLRTAHCGNLGSNSIQVLASTLKQQLAKYGAVNWSADLLGCFPSLSGIKAEEQPTTRASMQEIKAWLDQPGTKNELVFVYLDTGSELQTLGKFTALNALLRDVFGELLVPIAEWDALQKAGWTGETATGTLQRFIDQGRRVVLLANENTGLAFKMRDFCKGHQVLSTDHINALPDTATRTVGGTRIYSSDYLLRSYQSVLRYISLSDAGKLSQSLPVVLSGGNIANYVRWNLNLVATDSLDSSMVTPQIWSWAENEPRVADSGAISGGKSGNATTFSVVVAADGRWRVGGASTTKKACWNGSTLKWAIVDVAAECGSGFVFAQPMDSYQNYLLGQEIVAQKITDAVVINVI